MPKRIYNQFCPIAYGLDLIGERWTLLILREVLFGPRRYSDLLASLPGIGTNLLAARVKELSEAGILQQRKLPPPASARVYQLTELGKGLSEPMLALAQWGTALLKFPPPKAQHTSPTIALFYMKTFFNPHKARGVDLNAEVWLGEDYVFYISIHGGALELSTLPLAQPHLIAKTDLSTLFMLLQGGLSVQEGLKKQRVGLEKGQPEMIERLLGCFSRG